MHMINNKSTVDMIYLDFSKAFDKVDHGILLHKLRDLRITGRLGLWFFHFLNNMPNYVGIPGGISQPHPVLNGEPQGTVLGHLLFLIKIIVINEGISSSSKLVSFADDTRVYSCINDIEKCDQLQIYLNSVSASLICSYRSSMYSTASFSLMRSGVSCWKSICNIITVFLFLIVLSLTFIVATMGTERNRA